MDGEIGSVKLTRSRFIDQMSDAVQAVHSAAACCSNCEDHVLDKNNKDVRELCRILNTLFSYGLSSAYESCWPMVKEITSRHQAEEILNTWKPRTARGKALAWIYQSLNEGAMEWQIYSLLNNYSILNRYYSKNAFLLDKQILEMTGMFLRGLEGVRIYLQPKNSPPSKNKQNGCVAAAAKDKRSCQGGSQPRGYSTGMTPGRDVVVSRSVVRPLGPAARSSSKLLLEQSVADFSDCPEVIGLSTADSDLLLMGTEVSVDAMHYDFPQEAFRPWKMAAAASFGFLVPKRRIASAAATAAGEAVSIAGAGGRSVPKIDDGDVACSNSLETSNTFSCVPAPNDFDLKKETPGSTPLTQTAADEMLREILQGRRRETPEGSETPVETCKTAARVSDSFETSTPPPELSTSTDFLDKNGTDDTKRRNSSLFQNENEQFLSFNEEEMNPDSSILPKISTPIDHYEIKMDRKNGGQEENDQNFSNVVGRRPTDDAPEVLLSRIDADSGLMPIKRVYSDFERQVLNRFEKVFRHGGSESPAADDQRSFSETSSLIFNPEHGLLKEDRDRPTPEASEHDEEFFAQSGEATRSSIAASQDGEISLESGEIFELTANVMHDGEQFYKMFRVYLNHRLGTPLERRLLLSNKCLYLLIARSGSGGGKTENDNHNKPGGVGGKDASSDATSQSQSHQRSDYYVIDFRVPYDRMDYISVGLNGQFFNLHLKQKRQSIVVCTASDSFTRSILSNLDIAARRLNSQVQPPNVYTESRPQTICLKKWILGETGQDENRVCYYGLIYWNPNPTAKSRFGALSKAGPNRNGYLYVREFYPNGWFRKSTDWRQSYFILQGKKFYQFEDLSCKVGERVFNLQDEIIGCRQTETVEHTYCLELCFKDPTSIVIQLACPTKHELQQWLCAFFNSFSHAELPALSCSCSACCVVLTDHYVLLGQETTSIGFVRTLVFSRLEALVDFKTCRKFCSLILTISSTDDRENDEQWVLCFINQAELDNFLGVLKSLLSSFQCEELTSDSDSDQIQQIEESFSHWTRGWSSSDISNHSDEK